MTTRTEEIGTAVKTTGGGVGEAVTTAESLLELAQEMYESAAAHGWGAVASNMEQAREHLEGAVEQLRSTEHSCQTTTETVDEIDDKMSSPEVAEHLVTAIGEIDEALTTTHGAISLTDQAIQSCEAAGATGPGRIYHDAPSRDRAAPRASHPASH